MPDPDTQVAKDDGPQLQRSSQQAPDLERARQEMLTDMEALKEFLQKMSERPNDLEKAKELRKRHEAALRRSTGELDVSTKRQDQLNRNPLTRFLNRKELNEIKGTIQRETSARNSSLVDIRDSNARIARLEAPVTESEVKRAAQERQAEALEGEKNGLRIKGLQEYARQIAKFTPDLTILPPPAEGVSAMDYLKQARQEDIRTTKKHLASYQKDVQVFSDKLDVSTKSQDKLNRNPLTRFFNEKELNEIKRRIDPDTFQRDYNRRGVEACEKQIAKLELPLTEADVKKAEEEWHNVKEAHSVREQLHAHEGSWTHQSDLKPKQALEQLEKVLQISEKSGPPKPEELEYLKDLAEKLKGNRDILQTQGTGQEDPGAVKLGRTLDSLTKALGQLNPKGQGPQQGQKAGVQGVQEKHVSTRATTHLSGHPPQENGVAAPHVGQGSHHRG